MALDLEKLEQLAKHATPLPWHKQSFDVYGWKNKRRVFIAQTSKPIMRGIENIAQRLNDADYIEAACNAVPELIKRIKELERQRDWLIHYAWIDTNAPCPYEMGHFDQKKICPCWTPYHDWENAEDMSRDDWHDLLMEGVITEEDKVNCATDFCECLLAAAEHAAKEAGE